MGQPHSVLFVGVTGSGKTSLINMLRGKKRTPPSLSSATSTTSTYRYCIPADPTKPAAHAGQSDLLSFLLTPEEKANRDQIVNLVDTPGFLDNRSTNDREKLFNGMLGYIAREQLFIKKVFLLFPAHERTFAEVISWVTDLIFAMGNKRKQLVIVLTKIDDKDEVPYFDAMKRRLHKAFGADTTVIYSGKNNLEYIKRAIHPSELDGYAAVPFRDRITTSEALKKAVEDTDRNIRALDNLIQAKNASNRQIRQAMRNLSSSVSSLERQANNIDGDCGKEEQVQQLRSKARSLRAQIRQMESGQQSTTQQRDKLRQLKQIRDEWKEELHDRKVLSKNLGTLLE